MHIKQILVIVTIAFIGNTVATNMQLPIPGTVLGLILLFIALLTKIIKPPQVEDTAKFIVGNLSIFFIVPTVGTMLYLDLLASQLVQILVPLFGSTILGMWAAGKATELVIRKSKSKEAGND